ncbi:hypothetical protein CHLRE_12g547650v5 [Chlamydomonas reinhardtii]|uniref:Uncharacterized protein n=1 Tax=Chlamydomonas reinhardtii TaxID=3055 RepID=A0A2K3D6E9_CHLRE|nr:uncharacterized protein CHLRE_12g547650v5 [Chlamydomonas reinhardtii]PNW76104.1 hypothetical protein CHLRE_12g547650v5 [Chlamydomonas reinhardtii]
MDANRKRPSGDESPMEVSEKDDNMRVEKRNSASGEAQQVPPAVQAAIYAAVGASEERITNAIRTSEERTKEVIKTMVNQAVREALRNYLSVDQLQSRR